MADRIPMSAERTAASIRVAQVVGLTASAYLAGTIGSISLTAVPALLDAPAPLIAKQWKKIYDLGKVAAPPLSIISAAIFGGLAYREAPGSHAFSFYTAAAVLVPSIVPYTLVFMKSTNDKLIEKAQSLANASLSDTTVEAGVAEGETAHALVDKWATLNLGRSLLPLIGTLAAGWAVVYENYEVLSFASATLRSGANRMG